MSDFPSTGYPYDDPFAQSAHNNKKVTGKELAQIQAAMLFGYRNAQRAMANTPGVQNGSLNGLPIAPFTVGLPGISEHRLTLTSGTPVTTSDVTGATAIILEPHVGRGISLNDGFAWKRYEFDRQTIQLGTRTSGRPCDVFAKVSNGRFDYRLVEWSSGTARATAIVRKDGVYVMDGDYRWKYLGTFYTTSTTTTEDSNTKRFVWNMYNRERRKLRVTDATNTWNYTTLTWRQANNSAANQVEIVIGLAGQTVDLTAIASSLNASVVNRYTSIGINSATVSGADSHGVAGLDSAAQCQSIAKLKHYPAVGYSYYAWLEASGATGTTTWSGDNGDSSFISNGLIGDIWS